MKNTKNPTAGWGQLGRSHIVGGSLNWYIHFEQVYGNRLLMLNYASPVVQQLYIYVHTQQIHTIIVIEAIFALNKNKPQIDR